MLRNEYLPFGRPSFTIDEISAVNRVLSSGWVGMGPETIAFERELAEPPSIHALRPYSFRYW